MEKFRKHLIFHFEYETANNKGSRTYEVNVSYFLSKSKIIKEFMKWLNIENDKIKEHLKTETFIKNPKIIGI
jgi:hypothetical protein